jgi:hypothetical protein
MSLLHRQLLTTFFQEIEQPVLRALEGAAILAGPAAPVIDATLEAGDALLHQAGILPAAPAAAAAPAPEPAAAAAPPAVPAPAPAPAAAPAGPVAPAAPLTALDVIQALQATLAGLATKL